MDYLSSCSGLEAKDTLNLMHKIKEYHAAIRERRKQELYDTLLACKEERSLNRVSSRGWSKDRTLRKHSMIPQWMLYDKEYGKYCDPSTPYEDRKKEREKLLKRLDKDFGNFRVND